MTLPIQQWWINTYEQNIIHTLQQSQTLLSSCVSPATMQGAKRRFNYLGAATMHEVTGKNDDTVWDDATQWNRWISRRNYAHSDLIDKHADIENSFCDPTSDLVKAAVMAGNRQKDLVIIGALNAVAWSGENAETSVTFPSTQKLDIQLGSPSGAPANVGLTLAKLKRAKFLLDRSQINPAEPRFMAITAMQLQDLLSTTEITNDQYANVKALVAGAVDTFLGFKFVQIELLPWASQIRSCFAWTKESVKFAISTDITTHSAPVPTKNFNLGVQTELGAGAVRLFDKGVVEIPCAETDDPSTY